MDPLHDYRECVKIETARCQLRENCDPSFEYDTCVAYYKEFCRTRKLKGPGSDTLTDEMVQACVEAVLAVPCETLNPGVDETEALEECRFIQKQSEDTEADAGDQGTDDEDTDTDTELAPIPG